MPAIIRVPCGFFPLCLKKQNFFLRIMPRGHRIPIQMREIIWRLSFLHSCTPEEIHLLLYGTDRDLCSIEYLTKLCNNLRDPVFRENNLHGGPKSSGRPLSISYFHRHLIRQSVLSNKTRQICKMYIDYCAMFYPDANIEFQHNNNDHPRILSLSTFKRCFQRGQVTRKVI